MILVFKRAPEVRISIFLCAVLLFVTVQVCRLLTLSCMYFALMRQCRMQETAGLMTFPDAKGTPEREVISEPHLQFGGLGRLKLTVYRVGFQVQRELRNQFESWLRVGIAHDGDFREALTPSDSTTRRRLRLRREYKWHSSPIE